MVAEASKVGARMLPDIDWNALCHVSCSALSDGGPLRSEIFKQFSNAGDRGFRIEAIDEFSKLGREYGLSETPTGAVASIEKRDRPCLHVVHSTSDLDLPRIFHLSQNRAAFPNVVDAQSDVRLRHHVDEF